MACHRRLAGGLLGASLSREPSPMLAAQQVMNEWRSPPSWPIPRRSRLEQGREFALRSHDHPGRVVRQEVNFGRCEPRIKGAVMRKASQHVVERPQNVLYLRCELVVPGPRPFQVGPKYGHWSTCRDVKPGIGHGGESLGIPGRILVRSFAA